jgi:hypothetical protein
MRMAEVHEDEAGTWRKRKGTQHFEAKARSKGQRMLSVEVRGPPSPLIYRSMGAALPD